MSGRIVHLIDTGGPGGAETVFATLVEEFDVDGWASIPVVPCQGWLTHYLHERGQEARIERSSTRCDVAFLIRLVRLFRRQDADLVQTHLLGSAVYGSLAASLCRIPVVATFHGTVDVADDDPLQSAKFRWLETAVNHTVFVSDSLRRDIEGRTGFRPEHSAVIPNGIEVGQYSSDGTGAFRRELGVRSDEILVGSVGNVRPAKNYELLLRVAAELRDDPEPYRFVVVGEGHGRLWNDLMSLRAKLDLEEIVTFTGFRDDVVQVLADLDLYVLTSASEGFSLSTIQALASRLPVVATRCGGPEEIIESGIHGLLVEPGSATAIAAGLRELARNPARAHRLAAAGQRRVEESYSVGQMTQRYAEIYEACL